MRVLGLLIGIVFLGVFATTWVSSAESPTDRVRDVLEKAMDIQTKAELQGDSGRPQRAKLIRALIAENFLTAQMAQESLGDKWQTLAPGQRNEFTDLFIRLFQDSYTRMVLNFLRRETVEYLGEGKEGSRTKVRTKIMRVNEHIPVDYILVEKDNRWFMVDVIIDGVSIVRNYQNKFRQVIAAQSLDYLMNQMRIQCKAIEEGSS
jgi:phospholipid transport system substrate-binding protein